MKNRKPKAPVVKPFSPALNAALDGMLAQINAQIAALIQREAQSLNLPAGWSVDVGSRRWTLPA